MLSWIFGLLSIFSALAGLGFLWLAFRHGAAEDGSVSGDTIYFDPVDELDDVDEGLSDNIVSLQKQAAQQPQPDFLADINLDATLAEVPEIKPDIARPLTVKLDQALMTDKTLLIQVIENEGISDSAEQAARQLVKLAPNRPEHRLTLLKILAERNKYEDFDDNLQALYALGNIDASRQAKRLVQKLAVRQEDTIVSDTIDDALAKELTLTASVATGTHKALADTLSQNSLATHDEETPTASASASKSWTSKNGQH